MRKKVLSLIFALTFLFVGSFSYANPTVLCADSEKVYNVNVSLKKHGVIGAKELENAINPRAEIVKKNGEYDYIISFNDYKVGVLKTVISDAYFLIDGDKVYADEVSGLDGYDRAFKITSDKLLDDVKAGLKAERLAHYYKADVSFDVSDIPLDEDVDDDSHDSGSDIENNDGDDDYDHSDSSYDDENDDSNDNDDSNGGYDAREYEIPVKILHSKKAKQSMANKAVDHKAKIIEKNGEYQCSLYFKDLKIMGQKAGLKGLWVSNNGSMEKAKHSNVGGVYKDKFTFVLDSKSDVVMSEFKVPVMPIRPKARIMLNWDGTNFNDYDDSEDDYDHNSDNDDDNNDSVNEEQNADNTENNDTETNDSANYEPDVEKSDEHIYQNKYKMSACLENLDGDKSMANDALSGTVTVNENNGKYTYYVKFVPMKKDFGGEMLTGNLTNLFYYDGSKKQASYHGNSEWSFTLKSKKAKIKLAVWVDMMDELMGGEPGAAEQDVYLIVDWDKASKEENKNTNDNQGNQQDLASKDSAELTEAQKLATINDGKSPLSLKADSKISYERFADIKKTDWYSSAVSFVLDKKFMNGTSKITFSPHESTSRAMITTMLLRMAGKKDVTYKNLFNDVAKGRWYSDGIIWATENNIVHGYGSRTFGPDDVLTREQLATILYKYSELKQYDLSISANLNTFNDQNNISDYAKNPISWAVKNDLIKGTSKTNLSPKKDTTRAEIAVILERYFNKFVK